MPNTELMEAIVENLRTIYDPDLSFLNIYDMGLIYNIDINEGKVNILMTLTTPACPNANSLINKVIYVVESVPTVNSVKVDITFDPQWSIEHLSDALKYDLGLL